VAGHNWMKTPRSDSDTSLGACQPIASVGESYDHLRPLHDITAYEPSQDSPRFKGVSLTKER
jgi:hypothetical protein